MSNLTQVFLAPEWSTLKARLITELEKLQGRLEQPQEERETATLRGEILLIRKILTWEKAAIEALNQK